MIQVLVYMIMYTTKYSELNSIVAWQIMVKAFPDRDIVTRRRQWQRPMRLRESISVLLSDLANNLESL
jgi:hypothetical protein